MPTLDRQIEPHRTVGMELFRRGLLLPASGEFTRWVELVEPSGDPLYVLPALAAMVEVSLARLEFEVALGWLERAQTYVDHQRAAQTDKLKMHVAHIRVLTRLARYEEALCEADRARALLAGMADTRLRGETQVEVARLCIQLERWDEACDAATLAADLLLARGDVPNAALAILLQGCTYLERGEVVLADQALTRALRLSAAGGRSAPVYIHLGRLALLQGQYDLVLHHGSSALDALFHEIGVVDREEVAEACELLGILFAETGTRNLALQYLNRSAAYFSQLGRLTAWKRVTRKLAHALRVQPSPSAHLVRDETRRLDFLTMLLDFTDELEAVDPFLRGQSERVARLAVLLGQEMGLGGRQLQVLQHAGRLHDVGMVAVDIDVIRKAGDLSDSEWQRMRIHPAIGEQMVRPFGFDPDGLAAIRHHHEHWDGSGYPDGLSGEQIPLLARCLAVADVYDALTSHRVYRSALTHHDAMVELRRMAGSQLDPDLVAHFHRMHHV